MFLTSKQLQLLTGYKSRTCQRRWCLQNGVHFLVRGDASLVVSRQHVEELLGLSLLKQASQPEPDFTTLE